MKRLLTLMTIILVSSMIARSASAVPFPCICNHLPCPCVGVDGPICPRFPRICPILIDPIQLIKPPTA